MEQIYTPNQDYKVLVFCATYNQSKYIEEALNGFAMQKTNFPFACLVVEDCSTDGEQDAIKAWLERECDMSKAEYVDLELSNVILVPHKMNENCTFAIYLLKRNLWKEPKLKETLVKPWREHCEYEALCEGDDYWIAGDKLHKQVSFLEVHKEYNVCSHRIKRYDEEDNSWWVDRLDSMFGDKKGIDFNNRSKVWLSETSSILYRISADEEFYKSPCPKRDNVHMYYLLKASKGFCFADVMSVYRQNQGGIFAKQDLDTKLTNGSYKALKDMYEYEKTADARFLYYRCYALVFLLTRGGILFNEVFNFCKFISLPYFILSIVIGIHPVYKKI